MKEGLRLICLLFVFIGLVGCGNSFSNEVLEQAKEAMHNKEYDKAVVLYDIVLNKDAENKEAAVLRTIINDYLLAKEQVKQMKVEEAQKTIEGIHSLYNEYPIKDDIDLLASQIEEEVKNKELIDNEIHKLSNLYNEGKYDEAKVLASQITEEKLSTHQREKVNKISEQIDTSFQEKQAETEKRGKDSFTEKLDHIALGIEKDLSHLYAGSTLEMNKAVSEEYTRWDHALNEIYNVIKTRESESGMRKLKEAQKAWISYRDKWAEAVTARYEGGSIAPFEYRRVLSEQTKERCYELVETYLAAGN